MNKVMITEDYVSFEIAKLLKEKGFDEDCYTCYLIDEIQHYDYKSRNRDLIEGVISAPTLQMACKWLREVHNVNTDIVSIWNQKQFEYQVFVVTPENAKDCYVDNKLYLHKEEAVEVAIKYCLENLI